MISHSRQPNTSVAFTLIEMMLVVIVIGIFAALAVPYAGSASQSQLPAAMRILEADIAFAQAHAITHQDNPCVIVFDLDKNTYRIALVSMPEIALTHPGDNQPYEVKYGKGRVTSLPGITLNFVDVGEDNQLAFGSLGQLDQTTPATITLTDGRAKMSIALDPITGLGTISRH